MYCSLRGGYYVVSPIYRGKDTIFPLCHVLFPLFFINTLLFFDLMVAQKAKKKYDFLDFVLE